MPKSHKEKIYIKNLNYEMIHLDEQGQHFLHLDAAVNCFYPPLKCNSE